jgi:hypothetical protein
MTTCSLCGSLDFTQLFSEECRQLSAVSQDISVLYGQNSSLIARIKKLNLDLENFEENSEFYEDSIEDDDVTANAEEVLEILHQEETSSLEMDAWLLRESYLREQLMQQLLALSQDLSTLQLQHHHLQRHRQNTHLSQHLWGHQTLQWCPPSSPTSLTRARKLKQPERLLR